MLSILTFWFASGVVIWPCFRGLLFILGRASRSFGEAPPAASKFSLTQFLAYVVSGALLPTILAAGTTLGSIDENWQYGPVPYRYVLLAVFFGGGCGGAIAYLGESIRRPNATS